MKGKPYKDLEETIHTMETKVNEWYDRAEKATKTVEWQVVVGGILPAAGEKIVQHGVTMTQQKVVERVNQEIPDVLSGTPSSGKSVSEQFKNIPEIFVPVEDPSKSGGNVLCPSCNHPLNPSAGLLSPL